VLIANELILDNEVIGGDWDALEPLEMPPPSTPFPVPKSSCTSSSPLRPRSISSVYWMRINRVGLTNEQVPVDAILCQWGPVNSSIG
jgi:hypothetical protein